MRHGDCMGSLWRDEGDDAEPLLSRGGSLACGSSFTKTFSTLAKKRFRIFMTIPALMYVVWQQKVHRTVHACTQLTPAAQKQR
ncbi:hypothetical protein GCM10027565_00780 [Bordetella tumulicola]